MLSNRLIEAITVLRADKDKSKNMNSNDKVSNVTSTVVSTPVADKPIESVPMDSTPNKSSQDDAASSVEVSAPQESTPISADNADQVFKENRLLMDLNAQPKYVKKLIYTTIESALQETGKFNYFKFMRFCKKNNLINILDRIEYYVPLLSGK